MKVPGYKRFRSEDFAKEHKELIDKLSFSVNNGIEVLYEALNKKIDFDNNIASTIKDITLQVDANGTPTSTTQFSVDFTSSIKGLIVLRADNNTNTSVYPLSAPFVSWSAISAGVRIDNVKGLQAGNSYTLRILAIG